MGPRYLYISILILLLSVNPAHAQYVPIEPEDMLVDGQQGLSLAEVWKAEIQKIKEGGHERKYDNLDLTIEKKVELHYEQKSGRNQYLTFGYALQILIRTVSHFKSSCFDPAFPDPQPSFIVPLHVNREGDFRQFMIRWQSDSEHARKMKDLEPSLRTRMKVKRIEGSFRLVSVELVNTRSGEVIFNFQ